MYLPLNILHILEAACAGGEDVVPESELTCCVEDVYKVRNVLLLYYVC